MTIKPPIPARPDHMDVGTAFILLAVVAGLIGAGLSLWLRVPAGPVAAVASWRAIALQHGSILLFFSVLPALLGGFGNWFVPLQIGAHDTAFPRLAVLSFCLTAAGLVLTLGGLLAGASSLVLLLALHVSALAILLCAANLVATILNLRAPGMGLGDMPLFAWSQLIASCLAITALPMLTAAVTVLAVRGVPPVVPLQHLFRVLGYPGFCIMILPGFGVISEIVATLGGRPLVGRRFAIGAMAVLALAGFLVWAERLLRGGALLPDAGGSLPTLAIVLPALAMSGCWIVTLWQAPTLRLLRQTPGLFAVGFILVLSSGSLAALVGPGPGTPGPGSVPLHDVLSCGAVFAMFAGFYYWIGKMTGRSYPEPLGRLQFWLLFAGILLSMLPSAILAAAGAALTVLSLAVFALIVVVTLTRRRPVPSSPWGAGAATAEWRLPSPVPHRAARA
jgi:cytochrome c oxidase subunit 1